MKHVIELESGGATMELSTGEGGFGSVGLWSVLMGGILGTDTTAADFERIAAAALACAAEMRGNE